MKQHLKTILVAIWVVVGLAVTAGAWRVVYLKSHGEKTPLPTLTPVVDIQEVSTSHLKPLFPAPGFKLNDQEGKSFESSTLKGKVWVADFIFTSCTGLCPTMTQAMTEFQTRSAKSPIEIVSFSVDPENDTPAALKAYGSRTGADFSRWHYLTGTRDEMWAVSRGMNLFVGPGDQDHQISHSSKFLLVDKAGQVCGIYDEKDAGYMNKLVNDANALAAR